MQHTVTTVVDTVYDAIIRFSVRVVTAYVFPDEKVAEIPEREISQKQIPLLPKPQAQPLIEVTASSSVKKIPLTRGMIMYAGVKNVPLYKNPTLEFDAQISTIPFGAMVVAGEPKGRFYQINWGEYYGWVLREDLVESAKETQPLFVEGEPNEVDATNTSLVRALIKDEFGLSRSEFPLQAGEYILYRLWRKGLTIPWTSARPRTPGSWHAILKGQPGVHMSISPEPGTIMEYLIDGEIGHVAYVEAVFPDDTITVSEVNNPDSGIYREREIRKEEWREYRPVFIEIS